MAHNTDALGKLLYHHLCEDVGVDVGPDGVLMLRPYFRFPAGDSYPCHIYNGTRRLLLEHIISETDLHWDGVFWFHITPEGLPEVLWHNLRSSPWLFLKINLYSRGRFWQGYQFGW